MKIKIYASGIIDLTVARYFAAMEVDFAGFEITEATKLSVAAILEWIEGPKMVAEFAYPANSADATKLIGQMPFDYVLWPFPDTTHPLPAIELADLQSLPLIKSDMAVLKVFQNLAELSPAIRTNLLAVAREKLIFIDTPFIDLAWLDFISGMENGGILLKAGSEDKPGIKSFDAIDEIFSLLEH
ncbi:MAG: hypothetical protein IPN29_04795 [Saprospiraceae bacterium]|nr:hypothetical protein [Saprospiraceae bacterium]